MVYAQNKKFKGVYILVKNNILLTVLFASFTAPMFASFIPSQCPLGETGKIVAKFGAVFGAVDVVSSRYTRLPRAVTFHPNQQEDGSWLKAQAKALADETDPTVATVDPAKVEIVKRNLDEKGNAHAAAVAPRSAVKELLDTTFSFNLRTLGVDDVVTVNVFPAALKVVATYALVEAAKAAVAKVTGK